MRYGQGRRLSRFTSPAFSLVVHQVVFVLLTFNLLQIFLRRQGRKDLSNKPLPFIRRQLGPSTEYVYLYYHNYYGRFTTWELMGITARLAEHPRHKIASKCDDLSRQFYGQLRAPRPP